MSDVQKKRAPTRLSHYTTLAGLQGIVETKGLWASNASFLNDKAELVHALNAAEKAIRLLSSKRALNDWEPLIKRAFAELASGKRAESYVSCFCNDDDNLSQWRGYGGAVQGVSVTFDRARLSSRLKRDGAHLYSVTYTKLSTATKLRDALAAELQKIAELDELVGLRNEAERYSNLLSRISRLLPKFKHLGFRDEREWRYVVQKEIANKDMKFRVLANKIVPYVVIGQADQLLPIVAVRVGPGIDQDLTARSVDNFLRANGYELEINVSDVPFRT
ncbi:DUF2971 domain-containing protein [Brucella pseudintermedia]|uniref:DUF2971 domain-containing protein n=1 Tax=Brucella pseudintermedia TaxID=370111 RepID=UPI0030F3A855